MYATRVLKMDNLIKSNEFFTVILVLHWMILISEASDNFEDSTNRVNTPVLRNSDQPWAKFSSDYVRCFCNLPSCVHTGYMCKSNGGGCFSDLWLIGGFPTDYRGHHGCLELLNDKEKRCVNMTETLKSPPKRRNFPKPYVHCCYRDMCNYVDSPRTRYLINATLLDEVSDMRTENISNQRPLGYSNSEVWFRAATIAVPICGAVILFVLISLAVKILRSERQNNNNDKLGHSMMYFQHGPSGVDKNCYKYHQAQHYDYLRKQYPRPHNPVYKPTTVEMLDYHRQFQVPLLVQNEIEQGDSKNATNAKLNQIHCDPIHDYLHSGAPAIMLEIEKESSTECLKKNLDTNLKDEVGFSDSKYGDKNYHKISPII